MLVVLREQALTAVGRGEGIGGERRQVNPLLKQEPGLQPGIGDDGRIGRRPRNGNALSCHDDYTTTGATTLLVDRVRKV